MTSKTRNICLICLKRFGTVEEDHGYQVRVLSPSSGLVKISEKDDLNQHQDLYTRFLYFVNRYLKLTVASERFLSGAEKLKKTGGQDGPVQAFCESCQEMVSYVCDLYTELNAVKLHLFWKLEKLGEVMVKGKKAVSEKLARGLMKSLVTQLNVNAASSIISMRKHIIYKSQLKVNARTPKVLVHKGLFPEHWYFTYSATKRSLMVLIVIFALASSAVYAKKREEAALETDILAKSNKGRGRGSKKGVTFMDIKNNFDHHRGSRPVKKEKNDDTVDAEGSENHGGTGDGKDNSDNDDDDGPPDTFGNDAADSDWSHGAASPTSVGSAGSDADFDPTDSNYVPTRRWNLRRTRKRVLKMGAAKDQDMSGDDEDSKVDKEVKEKKRRQKISITDDRPRTLPCTKCNKRFVDTRGLSKHLLHIHGTCIDYSCPHCGLKFQKLQQMQKHKSKMHRFKRCGRGTYARGRAPVESRCRVCSEMFPTRNSMLVHKRQAHKIIWSKHECPICFKTVVSEERLQRHMRAHEQNVAKDVKVFYCEVCGKHFFKESSLSDHIVNVHDGCFPCSLCDAKYPSSMLLRTHLETHETDEKSFFCTYCFRGFTTQQYYDVHRKFAHRDKGKMFCDKEQCTEEFESVELLNEHLDTHVAETLAKRLLASSDKIPPPDGSGEVTATVTTESTSAEPSADVGESKEKSDKQEPEKENVGDTGVGADGTTSDLTNKLVEEDGTKVFKCFQCGWGFIKKYNLQLHELVHTPHSKDKTGYDCPKCGKNVRYLDTLLAHYNRVHGARIKQYKCEECNSAFSSPIWYKVHMKLHEERKSGKKFICETCNKDCLDSVSLARHIRDHKKDGVVIRRLSRYYDEMDPSSPPPGGKIMKRPGRPRTKPRTQEQLVKEKEEAAKWLQVPCEVCSETYESAYSLRKHLENNHENDNKSSQCYFCDATFTYKQTRELHVRAMHKEKKEKFECDDGKCEETFKTVTELNEHLKSHLGENPQQQEQEAAEGPMLDEQTGALIEQPELLAEMGTIPDKKVITCCPLCEWGFLNKDLMELHSLVHVKKAEDGYRCPRCEVSLKFNFIGQLQQHYNKYHGSNIKPYKCFECDKTFFSQITQINHIKRHNRRREQDPEASYICIDCGVHCIDAKLLAKHRKRHDPANHLKCTEPDCDLMFEDKKYLSVHLKRVHNKGERYPCPICGMTFIFQSYIKQHLITHQEGTFTCETCGKKFKRPHTLRKHQQTHDANRIATHICAECGMAYKSESGLKFHVDSMHTADSEKKFPCPHCPKRYHRKMLLAMHLKACMRLNGIVGEVSETTTPRKTRQGRNQSVRKQPPRQRRRPKKLMEEEEEEEEDDEQDTTSSEDEQYQANCSDPEEKPEVVDDDDEKPPVSSSMNTSAISAIISNLIGMPDLNDSSGKKVGTKRRSTGSTSPSGGISTFQSSSSTIDQMLFQSMTQQQLSNNGPSSSSSMGVGHSTTGQSQYVHNNSAYPSPFTNPFHHQYPDMPNLLGRSGFNLINSLNNSNSHSSSHSLPPVTQHQQYNMGGHGMTQQQQQQETLQQPHIYSPNHVYSPPPEQPQNLHFGNKYK